MAGHGGHANQLQFHVAGTAYTGSDPQQQDPERNYEKGNLHGPWMLEFGYNNVSAIKRRAEAFLVRKNKEGKTLDSYIFVSLDFGANT